MNSVQRVRNLLNKIGIYIDYEPFMTNTECTFIIHECTCLDH